MQNIFSQFSSSDDEENAPKKRQKLGTKPTTVQKHLVEELPMVVDEHIESVSKSYLMGKSLLPDNDVEEEMVVAHNVKHQVALPSNYNYIPIQQHVPLENSHRTYAFQLDPFQRTAINSIERDESVLVAAHTSAGKTVVAEYAIAQSLAKGARVIYTSPIKALSNQKYRDLLAEFGDVGLMTGDVTSNQDATCLVMTTEILRSMLYRGSELMREVAWVVFDEIHYMRDAIRGVVWEETLILLPAKVHFVFLSATIPNAMQFAQWICKIKNQPCHVVYTDYRPTPLQHYLFPADGNGIHLVVDEKSNFREDNFQKAIGELQDASNNAPKSSRSKKEKGKRGQEKKGSSDLFKIVKLINQKNFHPVIVFSFAKRECESNALLLSKIDFNTQFERDLVKKIFDNAVASLNEDDRDLPQISNLLPLLQRGIGIHHSGLLPILKEVIEIMFQEGLLKVLFATETFSIGLNMPAKTVVFTSVQKFDGVTTRWLSGGEYVQMSGRAGRRGLDDRGIVILMIDQKMEPDVAKSMLKGHADPLNSAFHLTYTMILNLARVDGVSHEFMLQSSFHQFQNASSIPQLEKDIDILAKRAEKIEIPNQETIGEYYQISTQLESHKKEMRKIINDPILCLPFIQPGRLIHIKIKNEGEEEEDFGWGIVVNVQKVFAKSKSRDVSKVTKGKQLIDALIYCKNTGTTELLPCPPGENGVLVMKLISFDSVEKISTVRLKVPNSPKDFINFKLLSDLAKNLRNVLIKFEKTSLPLLDAVKDMRVNDPTAFTKLQQRAKVFEERLKSHKALKLPDFQKHFEAYRTKMDIEEKIDGYKVHITSAEAALQLDELKCRQRLLRRLGYLSENDVIEMKGRVACEISAGDELVLTEMIFNGVFNDLKPEQVAALLSCFTCDEKQENAKLDNSLQPLFKTVRETASKIQKVAVESKVNLEEKMYLESFRSELMNVVYAWSMGAKFSQICNMTNIFEGSIIRSMRRLEELLRQLIEGANVMGNVGLAEKFEASSAAIKRDIVFASSLYL